MTEELDQLYPKGTLARHVYKIDFWLDSAEDAQEYAEREGHVPPGVDSIRVTWFGGYDQPRSITWQWTTGEDPTGQTKELWFADGPMKGQRPRAIDADTQKGALVAFPRFGIEDEFEPDGTLARTDYRYRVDQREDGLWFGRWAA